MGEKKINKREWEEKMKNFSIYRGKIIQCEQSIDRIRAALVKLDKARENVSAIREQIYNITYNLDEPWDGEKKDIYSQNLDTLYNQKYHSYYNSIESLMDELEKKADSLEDDISDYKRKQMKIVSI